MFYKTPLLAGAHKRRSDGFTRFANAIGLDEKQFSFSQPQKRFAAIWIGTLAEHFLALESFPNDTDTEAISIAFQGPETLLSLANLCRIVLIAIQKNSRTDDLPIIRHVMPT